MKHYHVKQIWENPEYWRRQCVIADSYEDAYGKAEFRCEADIREGLIKPDYTEVRDGETGEIKIFRGEG